MKEKTNTAKAKRRVLHDHVKIKSTFYPAFLVDPRLPVGEVSWRDNIMPELLWLALLVASCGFKHARNCAYTLALALNDMWSGEQTKHWMLMSSYVDLPPSLLKAVARRLADTKSLHALKKALAPMVRLYPSCPFKVLFSQDEIAALTESEAMQQMAPVLTECLSRRKRLPMLAQAIFYDVSIATGSLQVAPHLTKHNTEVLDDNPDSEEAQRVASSIRCIATMIEQMQKQFSLTWPQTFWAESGKIGQCRPQEVRALYPNGFSQLYLFYLTECFGRFDERYNQLWQRLILNYPLELYKPVRREILLGLLCRMYRLVVQQISFPVNWTEDFGQIYVRMVAESYIYYSWLSKNGTPQDFAKFYEHGLGQQKLYMEHLGNYFQEHGLKEDECGNVGADFLRKHKMPAFVPVNVGNPLGKNLRDLADECGCAEIYALLYGPCSSAVHGMYDTLDKHYLRTCVNPFHGGHRIPYFWYKSPVSDFGIANCLSLVDWAMADALKCAGRVKDMPEEMPGEVFLQELNDEAAFEQFKRNPTFADAAASAEDFVRRSNEENAQSAQGRTT